MTRTADAVNRVRGSSRSARLPAEAHREYAPNPVTLTVPYTRMRKAKTETSMISISG